MTARAALAALAVAAVAATPAWTSAGHADRAAALRAQIRHHTHVLRFFETHPRILYRGPLRVRREGWAAVHRSRAAKERLSAALRRLLTARTVYGQARAEAARLGVTGGRWECLSALISRENAEPPRSWDPRKWNGAGSGAYGLPQALPGGKMASAGPDWATSAATQTRWMIAYSNGRYGGVCEADSFQRTNGYY